VTMGHLALTLSIVFAGSPAAPPGGLAERAKLALLTSADVNALDVKVDADDGVVTLFGTVPTRAQRAAAARALASVPGVREVRNAIEVEPARPSPEPSLPDFVLRANVQGALAADPALAGGAFRVRGVERGAVTLEGHAESLAGLVHAVRVARSVPGVRSVAMPVEARERFGGRERGAPPPPPGEAGDELLAAGVKLQLLTSLPASGVDLHVDVSDGRVTLFGRVPSHAAWELAGRRAQAVAGVVAVDNHLQVSPRELSFTARADPEIDAALGRALSSRAALAGVEHRVADGVVRLTGQVADLWARVLAVRVALGVPGVVRVEQAIEVRPPRGGAA